jgi:perosamine synthetase
MIKNFGRANGGTETYDMFGLNFKYTDLQAVIGLAQFKKLPQRVQRYKEIGALYHNYVPSISFQSFPWFVDFIAEDRDALAKFLKLHGIESRVCYPALADTPNAKYVSNHGLFLPTHMALTNQDIKYICNILKAYKHMSVGSC